MKCRRCGLYLTKSKDDGTGAHIECPPTPDHEAYLRDKAERLPRLTYHVNRLQELDGTPLENIQQIHRELEERGL